MRKPSFWDGLMMGAAFGVAMGSIFMSRRRTGPIERTKMMVARTARRAMRKAHGTLSQMAGKFSD